MVIDIFYGDLTFHVVNMVTAIVQHSKHQHFFVIYLSEQKFESTYIELFKKLNIDTFKIIKPISCRLSFLIRFLLLFKKEKLPLRDYDFLQTLTQYRKETLLFHGYFFNSLIVFLIVGSFFKNVSWVCWGKIAAKNTNKKFSLKSQLLFLTNKLAYRKMRRIICLLQNDMDELMRDFKCKRISLCPYAMEIPTDLATIKQKGVSSNGGFPKILIGNNGHLFKEYIDFCEVVRPFKDSLDLTFMINYRLDRLSPTLYQRLREVLTSGCYRYKLWEDILPLNEYWIVLNQHDIYVCNAKKQSGLGAIYYMIMLEKSIYLTGYNFNWIQQLGFFVCSVDEFFLRLQQGQDLSFSPQQLKSNKKIFQDFFAADSRMQEWDRVLSSILK